MVINQEGARASVKLPTAKRSLSLKFCKPVQALHESVPGLQAQVHPIHPFAISKAMHGTSARHVFKFAHIHNKFKVSVGIGFQGLLKLGSGGAVYTSLHLNKYCLNSWL